MYKKNAGNNNNDRISKQEVIPMNKNSSVSELRGVGAARAAAFAKVGVATVGDLLRYYPRAYQNRGDVSAVADVCSLCRLTESSAPCSLILTVSSEPRVSMIRRGMTLVRFNAFDDSGVAEITYFNQPFTKDVFHTGGVFRLWGRPEMRGGRLTMANPVYEPIYQGAPPLAPIVPVYPLTKGLTQKFISGCVREALRIALGDTEDFVPAEILRKNRLCTLSFALKNIHFPEDREALESARRRLAFDEVFILSCAMSMGRENRSDGAYAFSDISAEPFLAMLPYELTGAQKRAVGEISADMSKSAPMCRILCGDVGSGKTAVAAAAAYIAAAGGKQCALMAPTEILAKQHFADLAPMFERLGFGCALLCGSMSAAAKRQIKNELASPLGPKLIIGTHALLSEDVEFNSLALVITDEQHRFGVNQRAELRRKAGQAHTLVMSATPIPRTLSLAMLGDIEVSRLDEMPPGRKKVATFKVDESYRQRLLGFIRKQKDEGHRAYVVCPAIDESDKKAAVDAEELFDISFARAAEPEIPMKAAAKFSKELEEALPGVSVGLMHGKMKTAEKDAVMSAFAAGELDVLVSTTVIEVGVNVPAATLMVIENAERFGLSQLHQLRGRVGRGSAKSWCILVSDTKNDASLARLDVMCKTNDGFKIAEEDLAQRGPGDLFARSGEFRQHGAADMTFSSGVADAELINAAADSAAALVMSDPALSAPEHQGLRKTVFDMTLRSEDNIS